VLANAGLEYPGGTTPAPAFFFPMAQVFQDGVANYLRKRLSGVRLQAGRSINAEWGTPDHTLSYVPDITVGDPPSMVLDTKYARAEVRNQYGGLSFRNSNAYQIVFYAHALGCPGVLVYPRDDRDVNADYQVEGTRFTFLTVDLETGGLLGLEALAVELERRLARGPRGDRSELPAALGDAVVPPELARRLGSITR
jgi:5-methylcytosine-specific restriction endonuclease McrBC regulatory subunit McrC